MACFSFKTHKKRLQKFGRKQNKSRTWSQTQNLKIIANGFLIENGEKQLDKKKKFFAKKGQDLTSSLKTPVYKGILQGWVLF